MGLKNLIFFICFVDLKNVNKDLHCFYFFRVVLNVLVLEVSLRQGKAVGNPKLFNEDHKLECQGDWKQV